MISIIKYPRQEIPLCTSNVKNDNVEIAEIIIRHPKYIKNIQNKLGETPKDICKEKKGKIFYQIIAKEQQRRRSIKIF